MVSPNLCSNPAFHHADVEVRRCGFVHLHAAVWDHKHGPIWELDVGGSQGLELDQLCLTETSRRRVVRQMDPWRVSWSGLAHWAGILFRSLPGRKWTGPCLHPLCQYIAHIWHRSQPAPPGGLQTEHIKITISAMQDVYFQAASRFMVYFIEDWET